MNSAYSLVERVCRWEFFCCYILLVCYWNVLVAYLLIRTWHDSSFICFIWPRRDTKILCGTYTVWLTLPSLPFSRLEVHIGFSLWSLLSHFSDPQGAVNCLWIITSIPAYISEIQVLPHSVSCYLFRGEKKLHSWVFSGSVWSLKSSPVSFYHQFYISCHWPLNLLQDSKISKLTVLVILIRLHYE